VSNTKQKISMCINHAIFGGLIAIGGSELLTSLDYIFEVGLTKDVSETGKMVVNLGMGSFGAVVGLLWKEKRLVLQGLV